MLLKRTMPALASRVIGCCALWLVENRRAVSTASSGLITLSSRNQPSSRLSSRWLAGARVLGRVAAFMRAVIDGAFAGRPAG